MTNIVLNEILMAETILSEKTDNAKDFGYTASLLAKYYFNLGFGKKAVYEKLDGYFTTNCEWYNSVLNRDVIDSSIAWAIKHPIINVPGVSITKSEIDKIRTLQSKPMQRVLFVYLCIAKFNYAVNEKTDYWVSTSDSDVFRMAHVSVNSKKRDMMLHDMRELGFITFAKAVDSLSIRIAFVDEDSRSVAFITSFDDLYSEWRQINGERAIICQECGRKVIKTGRAQKYCKECSKKVHIAKTSEVRKYRSNE